MLMVLIAEAGRRPAMEVGSRPAMVKLLLLAAALAPAGAAGGVRRAPTSVALDLQSVDGNGGDFARVACNSCTLVQLAAGGGGAGACAAGACAAGACGVAPLSYYGIWTAQWLGNPSALDRHRVPEAAMACALMLLPLPPPRRRGDLVWLSHLFLGMFVVFMQRGVRRWLLRRRRAARLIFGALRAWRHARAHFISAKIVEPAATRAVAEQYAYGSITHCDPLLVGLAPTTTSSRGDLACCDSPNPLFAQAPHVLPDGGSRSSVVRPARFTQVLPHADEWRGKRAVLAERRANRACMLEGQRAADALEDLAVARGMAEEVAASVSSAFAPYVYASVCADHAGDGAQVQAALRACGSHERRAERVLAAGGSVSCGVGGEGWRRAERVLAEGGSVSKFRTKLERERC